MAFVVTAPIAAVGACMPEASRLRSAAAALAVACLVPCAYAAWQLHARESPFAATLATVGALACGAFAATTLLIPPIAELNTAADLFGIDINKRGLVAGEPAKMCARTADLPARRNNYLVLEPVSVCASFHS